MEVQIDIWAVLLATAASMAVGAFWYARPVFGNAWIKATKLDPKQMESGSALPLILTFIVSLTTAYVIAHVSYLSNQFFQHSFLRDALTTAFWLWLGLTAARMITHDLFERRPAKLTFINVAHEFVTIMVMAFIIGVMKV